MDFRKKKISEECLEKIHRFIIPWVNEGVIKKSEYNLMMSLLSQKLKRKKNERKQARLISRKECAKRLSISVRQVDRMADNGIISRVKLGRKCIRFNLQQINQIINGEA